MKAVKNRRIYQVILGLSCLVGAGGLHAEVDICKGIQAGLTLSKHNNHTTETVYFGSYDSLTRCSFAVTQFKGLVEHEYHFLDGSIRELFRRVLKSQVLTDDKQEDFWNHAFNEVFQRTTQKDYQGFPTPVKDANGNWVGSPVSWVGTVNGEKMIAVGWYDEDGDNVYLFKMGNIKPVLNIRSNN